MIVLAALIVAAAIVVHGFLVAGRVEPAELVDVVTGPVRRHQPRDRSADDDGPLAPVGL